KTGSCDFMQYINRYILYLLLIIIIVQQFRLIFQDTSPVFIFSVFIGLFKCRGWVTAVKIGNFGYPEPSGIYNISNPITVLVKLVGELCAAAAGINYFFEHAVPAGQIWIFASLPDGEPEIFCTGTAVRVAVFGIKGI